MSSEHRVRVDSPWGSASFRWFFAGRAVSLTGSSMAPVALAFAVLEASQRPSDFGVVLVAHMVPLLVLLLVGGAVAGRFSRRAVLVLANSGSGRTQGAVAVVLLTGHYSLAAVAGLSLANGVIEAFTGPALRGVVPELVAPEQIQRPALCSVRPATPPRSSDRAWPGSSWWVSAGEWRSLSTP